MLTSAPTSKKCARTATTTGGKIMTLSMVSTLSIVSQSILQMSPKTRMEFINAKSMAKLLATNVSAGRNKSTSYALLPKRQANLEFGKFALGLSNVDIIDIDVSSQCIIQVCFVG